MLACFNVNVKITTSMTTINLGIELRYLAAHSAWPSAVG